MRHDPDKLTETLEDHPEQVVMDRLEVVREELHSAVRLFFGDRAFISAHLLACSAHEIIMRLAPTMGVDTLKAHLDQQLLEAVPESELALVRSYLDLPKNFAKHGSKNIKPRIKFRPDYTAGLLAMAVVDYTRLTGESTYGLNIATAFWAIRAPQAFSNLPPLQSKATREQIASMPFEQAFRLAQQAFTLVVSDGHFDKVFAGTG